MHPKNILIAEFNYYLPTDKIAYFPLQERDASKLLVYKKGEIKEDIYQNIAQFIPENALLVFNNTRVIQARILFQKESGGNIEIFCLEPFEEQNEYSAVMNKTKLVRWKCMIGGASKWKTESLHKKLNTAKIPDEKEEITLSAKLIEKLPDGNVVEFSWIPSGYTFAEILGLFGDTPLPPYIKRKAEDTDKLRYQTIYAKHDGSVAAPTAGLHFTERIFESFRKKNIRQTYVTLHVSAGTFKPVKAVAIKDHEMHSEWIDVDLNSIQTLIDNSDNCIIAVGTTSARTIETLYWMGVKTILFPESSLEELTIHQWDVYETSLSHTNFSVKNALSALINWMKINGNHRIITNTQILIAPGYKYQLAKAIITNFHQPQSTLLLLVTAAVGKDWKTIYSYAQENNFRFLSYGDGSLLFINEQQ